MRLIDADAVMNFWYRDEEHEESIGEFLKSFCDEPIPTVDAVPVARCRDCVKFDARYGICNEDTWSSGSDGYAPCVNSDVFCSFAERREKCGE